MTNLPAGLSASYALNSERTVLTLTLTGTANAHANSNDVSDLTVTLAAGAFTSGTAATGATKNDIGVNFKDASSIAYAGTLTESAANDGSVGGEIVATLTGDTFTAAVVSGNHVSASNVPGGLTASFARTSATKVALTLTGTATSHASANDISNLTVTFTDGAFTNEGAATVAGSTKNDIAVSFVDATSITWAGSFTEAAANNGSMAGSSVTATLAGDTFTAGVATGTGVTVTNLPGA